MNVQTDRRILLVLRLYLLIHSIFLCSRLASCMAAFLCKETRTFCFYQRIYHPSTWLYKHTLELILTRVFGVPKDIERQSSCDLMTWKSFSAKNVTRKNEMPCQRFEICTYLLCIFTFRSHRQTISVEQFGCDFIVSRRRNF